ncbi:hypothetical protein HOLDEFILI_03507 [Holdemania filiformis DSM 12042]|uniref:Uncharacterized protein n=1 Tax=Holdemania filiformis DSM 12042 TaxID=545696 RepID=B9YCE6_9FIRM|nr:hypothetical protein HOLDEFILI_03507 [Holdemania filiformis DSM 12042]
MLSGFFLFFILQSPYPAIVEQGGGNWSGILTMKNFVNRTISFCVLPQLW